MQNKIHQILDKGKSASGSELDKKEMLSLFHQPDHEYELKGILLQELQETGDENGKTPFFKDLFAKLWAKIDVIKKEPVGKVRFLKTFGRIAAAVVLGLFIGYYVSTYKNLQNPVYYSAQAPKGSISEMILPDSSIIFLNAGSNVKYSYNGENGVREVFLEGEAWFDVNKNKKKPFLVHTSCFDIQVTGTQFNVKSYKEENKVITTLEEGEIIIRGTDQFKLAEDIVVKPGEQVCFNKETKKLAIKEVNTQWYTSWKDNKLIFVNMSLEELVILLERKYGVDIEIDNKDILDLHFDGTIKDETIIELLDIIKKTLPIDYKIIDQKIKISSN